MTLRPARRPPAPIPVTVLTGFLGAGKTSLLNDLLRDGALADTVVLINEFGDVGLDHLLVERIDGDMLLMASGCVCCTIRGDLVNALEGLLRRRDNERIAPFARVLIETTGLADPVPVLQTLIGHPYFAMRFRLEAVVTVVDAINGRATLERHREAARQVAMADRIVISKTDLPASDFTALRARLRELNARASIMSRADGEATADALLGDASDAEFSLRQFEQAENPEADGHHGHSSHEHSHHENDHNRHNDSIRSFALVRETPIAAEALQVFLDLLRMTHAPNLLRLKGFVALADDPARPLVVHAVQHLLHPPQRLDKWPDSDRRTRLVLIGDGLDRGAVEALFAAVCGEIAPDQPDLAALRESPLSPATPGGLLA